MKPEVKAEMKTETSYRSGAYNINYPHQREVEIYDPGMILNRRESSVMTSRSGGQIE